MADNSKDRAKLHQICGMSYKAQAVWFLNSFWDTHSGESEKFWAYVNMANTIDVEKHEDGCALDELNAHRLLEIFDETLTVREMRTQLRSVGAIDESERPKLVPLAHLLLARYKVDWHHFVNAPQGNQEEINQAQAQLDATKAAFAESEARASAASHALRAAQSAEAAAQAAAAEAKATEDEALAREADAREAEAPFKAAQEEVEAALAAVHREEAEYNGKIEDCKRRSEEGGVVQRNKAKNELAQLQAEDPLPLRKAKITLEAANKRAERARAPFEAATKVAEAARQVASAAREDADAKANAASQARAASEEAKAAADAALAAAEAALAEAEAFLEEVKKTASGGKGALWWIERELHEQKKYLPTSRGGIARK